MHDDHLLLGQGHEFGGQDELVTRGLVLGRVGESLFLYASHVHHVRVWEGLFQGRVAVLWAGERDHVC